MYLYTSKELRVMESNNKRRTEKNSTSFLQLGNKTTKSFLKSISVVHTTNEIGLLLDTQKIIDIIHAASSYLNENENDICIVNHNEDQIILAYT